MARKAYPSDAKDDEWAFVAPYLTLIREDAPQREHSLRELFNGLRYLARCGGPWRMLPNDLPPWHAVYEQTQRWIRAGVFEAMIHDLRAILRVCAGKNGRPHGHHHGRQDAAEHTREWPPRGLRRGQT